MGGEDQGVRGKEGIERKGVGGRRKWRESEEDVKERWGGKRGRAKKRGRREG